MKNLQLKSKISQMKSRIGEEIEILNPERANAIKGGDCIFNCTCKGGSNCGSNSPTPICTTKG